MREKEEKQDKKEKKTGGLSTTKLLAAAFAAITASLITTRLTSYVGSVLIVGISSMLIAVLSEVYTRVIKKTKRTAAKITYNAVPYEKILPDSISDRIDAKLLDAMTTTTTLEPVKPDNASETHLNGVLTDETVKQEQVIASEIKTAENPVKTISSDAGRARLVKSHESIGNIIDAPDEAHVNGHSSDMHAGEKNDNEFHSTDETDMHIHKGKSIITRFSEWIINLALSPITKTALFFLIVALITSGMSWATTTYVKKPDVTNVTVQEVQKLSDNEKNAIKQQVKAEVSSQINAAQSEADKANDSATGIQQQIDAMQKRLNALESTESSDDSDTETTNAGMPDYSNEINDMKTQITSLQNQLDSMKTQLDSLKQNSSEQTQTTQ